MEIPEHLRPATRHARRACMSETNVDEKDIEQSKNGYIVDKPEMGCYINCLLIHFGMIGDDGSIIWNKVVHMLPPSYLKTLGDVLKGCGTKSK